jgi:hypothetical protein
MLRRLDAADLLPPSLTPTKIADLIGVLERTKGSTTPDYEAKYIPWRRVARFLHRSLAVSERYLRQTTLNETPE